MPQLPVGVLRRRLREGLEAMTAPRRIVVFSCEQGADAAPLAGADSLVLPLICTGQLPPSFVEYALRDGAEGVLVASCRETGCAFRLGARWTAERLTGVREPHLRKTVPADRVRLVRADAGETAVLAAALRTMREFLPQIKENPEPEAKIYHG
jgi:coenzyme F420-reducing hydrogenase delta subunit